MSGPRYGKDALDLMLSTILGRQFGSRAENSPVHVRVRQVGSASCNAQPRCCPSARTARALCGTRPTCPPMPWLQVEPPVPPPVGLITDAEILSGLGGEQLLAMGGPQRTHQYMASRLVG